MVPLLGVTGVTIIIAVWTSVAFLALLPVEFLVMKSLTRNEPMRFSLIAVWLRQEENRQQTVCLAQPPLCPLSMRLSISRSFSTP